MSGQGTTLAGSSRSRCVVHRVSKESLAHASNATPVCSCDIKKNAGKAKTLNSRFSIEAWDKGKNTPGLGVPLRYLYIGQTLSPFSSSSSPPSVDSVTPSIVIPTDVILFHPLVTRVSPAHTVTHTLSLHPHNAHSYSSQGPGASLPPPPGRQAPRHRPGRSPLTGGISGTAKDKTPTLVDSSTILVRVCVYSKITTKRRNNDPNQAEMPSQPG